jgi:hypothetical protein
LIVGLASGWSRSLDARSDTGICGAWPLRPPLCLGVTQPCVPWSAATLPAVRHLFVTLLVPFVASSPTTPSFNPLESRQSRALISFAVFTRILATLFIRTLFLFSCQTTHFAPPQPRLAALDALFPTDRGAKTTLPTLADRTLPPCRAGTNGYESLRCHGLWRRPRVDLN